MTISSTFWLDIDLGSLICRGRKFGNFVQVSKLLWTSRFRWRKLSHIQLSRFEELCTYETLKLYAGENAPARMS
jgi:hypothetical protein